MINIEDKAPADPPLRAVKRRCDQILADMRRDLGAAYSRLGRPSIPPEQFRTMPSSRGRARRPTCAIRGTS